MRLVCSRYAQKIDLKSREKNKQIYKLIFFPLLFGCKSAYFIEMIKFKKNKTKKKLTQKKKKSRENSKIYWYKK